jgi:hypothetical protein
MSNSPYQFIQMSDPTTFFVQEMHTSALVWWMWGRLGQILGVFTPQ